MKIIIFLIMLPILHVSAFTYGQKVTLKLENSTLKEILNEIQKQTGYDFLYNSALINTKRKISLDVKNVDLDELLSNNLKKEGLAFELDKNTVLIRKDNTTNSMFSEENGLQSRAITGRVTDEQGEPLESVTVKVKGSNIVTSTNAAGRFSININEKYKALIFSAVGFSEQEVQVTSNLEIEIQLNSQVDDLEEVIVVGYGTMRKRDVTGTISSVKGEVLAKVPVSSAAEALTGRISGVQVTTQDGSPGSDVDIKIRGGMSITQDNTPLYIVDGFASDVGLKGIHVNDIESVEVLKDASTTSIYGARGANGVVLITTKSGKAGKTIVSFDGYIGIRKLPKQIEVLNTLDYVNLQYEMALRAGGSVFDSFKENYGEFESFQKQFGERGLNWQELMFGGKAWNHNNNISISGGTKNNTYLISYSQNSEKGILMNTNNLRNNLRLKVNQSLNDKLSMTINAFLYDNRKNGDITSGNTLQNTLLYRPVAGISYTEEELQDAIDDPISNSLRNPKVSQLSRTRFNLNRNLTANLALNYKFSDHLTLNLMGSGTLRNGRTDSFDDKTSSAATSRGGSLGSQLYSESFRWQNSNTLSYKRDMGKHRINSMIGNEMLFTESRSLKAENRQFPDDNFGIYDLSLGSLPQKPVTSFQEDGLISYFARIFYSFNNRYLLTTTLRSDGSSKFSKQNRFGYFPSISAAWRIDQENFLKNNPNINELKIRLSYGQSGNNRIGNNRYRSIFEPGWYANGSSETPTLVPKVLANPELKWETTISSNFGIDFGFFKNKIHGSTELYFNTSRDLLLTASIPSTTGYSTQTRNIGSTQNRGVEFMVTSKNISGNKFSWTSDFNISFNKNKVLALVTGTNDDYMLFKSGVGSYMEDYLVKVGESTGLIYGYEYDGFYGVDDFDASYNEASNSYSYSLKPEAPSLSSLNRASFQPGSTKYKDINMDGSITPDDRKVIGNTNPKHFGGLNNTFTYQNFSISIFLNWMFGNDILNYTQGRMLSTYQQNQNQSAELLKRFTYLNENGEFVTHPEALKALNINATKHAVNTAGPESNLTLTQSEFVEDGSFLRINNISLGYTIENSWMRKLKISSCYLYATLHNVYTFTNYSGFDPEVNRRPNGGLTPGIDWSAYPKTKNMVFGINLKL